jgi:nucleotide-binding universal stress UspA family protein
MMFKTILWATDGSEDADRALPYARALAGGEGAMLVAAHIVQKTIPRTTGAPDAPGYEDDLGDRVVRRVAELSSDGLDAMLRVVSHLGPQPAQGIADLARELGVDVIVVGTPGHSPLGGLMTGSVTQYLVQIAPCPVLVIGPEAGTIIEPREDHATGDPA